MKIFNWDIAGNPVNWVKIGLMSATFILAALFVSQLVVLPSNLKGLTQ